MEIEGFKGDLSFFATPREKAGFSVKWTKGRALKVFNLVDKPPANKPTRKGGKARPAKKKPVKIPPRENVSADQIRAKVKAHTAKTQGKGQMSAKERMAEFESKKIPDMEDAEKRIMGDVGKNDPNDLATHGKLKKVLSMGAFSFNEKERAALENILKD